MRKENIESHLFKRLRAKILVGLCIAQLFSSSYAKSQTTYPKHITVQKNTALRSTSYFSGSKNWLGLITKGDTGEVLAVDDSQYSGVGLKVKVTSGKNHGKVGWIYYSRKPKNRSVSLSDINKKKIKVPKVKIKQYFKKVNENIHNEEQAKFLNIKYQVKRGAYVTKENTNAIIWKTLGSGTYEIDYNSYTGGDFLPVWALVRDEYGNKVKKRVWVKRDYAQMISQTYFLAQKYLRPPQISCTPLIGEDQYLIDERSSEELPVADKLTVIQKKWIPGCRVLAGELNKRDYDKLAKCFSGIKEKIRKNAKISEGLYKGKYNRDKVFENLYRELNPIEQEFAAMTIGAIGEAGILAPPLEEMVAVMKVLSNRKEYALKEGYEKTNELDVALQPFAFSMFNKNKFVKDSKTRKLIYRDNGWEGIISRKKHNSQDKNAMLSYIKFFKSKFKSKEKSDKIYHYYSPLAMKPKGSKPDWAINKSSEEFVINGNKLRAKGDRHVFYKKIAWSYVMNDWRKKVDKE